MHLKKLGGLWLLTALILIPTGAIGLELERYQHVTDGVMLGIGRGITLFNKELESNRTEGNFAGNTDNPRCPARRSAL